MNVLYFVIIALAIIPLFREVSSGGRMPVAAAIAVAVMGFVGYNSRWIQSQSPGVIPLGIAVIAGFTVWVGFKLDLPGKVMNLWGGDSRARGGSRADVAPKAAAERRSGLPVASPDFNDVSLREVMTPKAMIAGIDGGSLTGDAVRVASSSGHSRLIVYEDDLDHIVGVVSIHSLLEASVSSGGINRFTRPALFVPESKKCFGMLEDFLREREQFAVALDEFGGTAGVVTVEDLLDELVGEMADEHDSSEAPVRRMSDGSYLVPGHMKIDELNERLGLSVPEGDYETISGFVLEKLGRVPARGERLSVEAVTLEIAVSTARRIVTIKVAVDGGRAAPPSRDV